VSNGDDLDRAEASYEYEVVGAAALGCTISIELDDEMNGGRTCFLPGEEFYIKVYSPISYDIYTTGGSVRERLTGIAEDVPDPNDPNADEWEYVNFSGWEGSASKPIYDMIDEEWCFHELGQVKWTVGYSEMTVTYDADSEDMGYGVYRIQFKSRFDRIRLLAPAAGHDIKVVVFSTDDSQPDCEAELQVEIRDDCEKGRPKEVVVEVEDCLSNNAIEGVSVYISGQYKGVTDSSGQLYIGLMNPGEYTISFSHPSYWPSANDGVINDSFVVE
jgi:hypothetical protein